MGSRSRAMARLGAAGTVIALVLGASLAVAPAGHAAGVTISGLRAEAVAARGVALTWDTAGADAYRVRFSTNSSMGSPETWDVLGNHFAWNRTDANPTVSASRLSPGTTYYFQVKAIDLDKSDLSAYSRVLPVTTPDGDAYPELPPTELTATAGGPGAVYLSWTSRVPGLSYRVRYTADDSQPVTSWKSVDFDSAGGVVTGLSAGTTYHFAARAIAGDGTALSEYSATEAQATASSAASPGVTVSTYNVHKARSGPSWPDRREAVAKNITSQSPDVIALGEATPISVTNSAGDRVRQYTDLLELIDDDIPYKYAASGDYTSGTKLAYNSARLVVLAQGSKILKKLGSSRRYAVWATFEDRQSGKRLFVVATHLEPGKGSASNTKYNKARVSQARQILALVADKNPKGHPVVIAGDLNSSRSTKPSNGPYNVFLGGGMVDPLDNAKASWTTGQNAIAETMIDVEYSSYNDFERKARRTSFPIGTNVDYVLVSRGVRVAQYQTVVDVDSDGRFVGTIPSDHNQVKAIIHLP